MADEKRKSELLVWGSPAWDLKREGTEVKIVSACGLYPEEREELTALKITVEEV